MLKHIPLTLALILMHSAYAGETLPLYAGAALLDQKISIESQHHWALSKNKEIDGRWRFEKEQKLQALLIKNLYEITTEDSYAEVADYYQTQLVRLKDAKILFQCKGQLCGSSNEWANTLFNESRLYGPDENQYYWAMEYQQHYWSAYLIQRGNKRIYWYVEEVEPVNVLSLATFVLSKPCHIEHDADSLKTFLGNAKNTLFLLDNKAGINTLLASQQEAVLCAQQLQTYFPNTKVRAIGLGEYDRETRRRVMDDKIELIRFVDDKH